MDVIPNFIKLVKFVYSDLICQISTRLSIIFSASTATIINPQLGVFCYPMHPLIYIFYENIYYKCISLLTKRIVNDKDR